MHAGRIPRRLACSRRCGCSASIPGRSAPASACVDAARHAADLCGERRHPHADGRFRGAPVRDFPLRAARSWRSTGPQEIAIERVFVNRNPGQRAEARPGARRRDLRNRRCATPSVFEYAPRADQAGGGRLRQRGEDPGAADDEEHPEARRPGRGAMRPMRWPRRVCHALRGRRARVAARGAASRA